MHLRRMRRAGFNPIDQQFLLLLGGVRSLPNIDLLVSAASS
jgi:hypothetical protein